jgi:collagen type III alpha
MAPGIALIVLAAVAVTAGAGALGMGSLPGALGLKGSTAKPGDVARATASGGAQPAGRAAAPAGRAKRPGHVPTRGPRRTPGARSHPRGGGNGSTPGPLPGVSAPTGPGGVAPPGGGDPAIPRSTPGAGTPTTPTTSTTTTTGGSAAPGPSSGGDQQRTTSTSSTTTGPSDTSSDG